MQDAIASEERQRFRPVLEGDDSPLLFQGISFLQPT